MNEKDEELVAGQSGRVPALIRELCDEEEGEKLKYEEMVREKEEKIRKMNELTRKAREILQEQGVEETERSKRKALFGGSNDLRWVECTRNVAGKEIRLYTSPYLDNPMNPERAVPILVYPVSKETQGRYSRAERHVFLTPLLEKDIEKERFNFSFYDLDPEERLFVPQLFPGIPTRIRPGSLATEEAFANLAELLDQFTSRKPLAAEDLK